ncbi:MAG TPA: ABC transporter substrate-binding protein [Clostridia bacterium]|nr:ABC transporter substrate-binding protein [Clostridia bacterium]
MVRIKKVLLIFFTFIFLVLSIAGCKQQDQGQNLTPRTGTLRNQPKIIRAGFLEEVRSLDPVMVKTFAEIQIAKALYEGLFTYDGITGEPVPDLVEEWSLDDEGIIYSFTLKKGVKFHSGRHMTAGDVKYSWERMLRKEHPYDLFSAFSQITGAREFLEGKKPEVTGIRVLDDGLLQVQLESPNSGFLEYLTHPGASILDMQVVELLGERYGTPGTYLTPAPALVGTGPFSFVEWIHQRHLTVQRFTQYHGELSSANRLEFHFYADLESLWADWQGEYLDMGFAGSLSEDAGTSPGRLFEPVLGNEVIFLGFNPGQKPFDLLELRQAISYAMDRNSLAAGETGGRPMEGLLPRQLLQGRSPLLSYRYDPQKARQLLETENLQTVRERGLALAYPLVGSLPSLAERIKAQLEAVGLTVTLQSFPEESFVQALKAGDLGFYLYGWPISVPLAESFLDANLYFPGYHFSTGLFDQAFYELREFIQSRAETDRDRRESLLQMERMIMNQAPVITLLEKRNHLTIQPGVEVNVEVSEGTVSWGKLSLKK